MGLSPLLARELAFEAFGETDAPVGRDPAGLYARLSRLLTQVEEGKTTPTLLVREGSPVDVSFRPILQYGPTTESRSCQTSGPCWTSSTRRRRPPSGYVRRDRTS